MGRRVVKSACYIVFGVFVLAHAIITASAESPLDETKVARTDLVDKTVRALKSAFFRLLEDCDVSCRSEQSSRLTGMDLDEETMSKEAVYLINKVKSGEDIDLPLVNSWIEHAGYIQENYFNSVFRYHKTGDVKDALFFLEIGEPHKAAAELLKNQRTLTQIVADSSVVLKIIQGGRSGLTYKLLNQLADLTPYHDTFGCVQSTKSTGEDDSTCANLMKASFESSFITLQDTLTKFVTTELTEDDLLSY
ncbi:hypothetical protein BIW11_05969 [Tropilaelaps mercedesae]|uniref:Uncharacterized protein n=1 Tax=Tropilaelaps mercedesae TaxID=418985 RepID=A0A1V9Y079_9ACAR|nr:hypothetical protein BIW11_05969 [Tropilaelaps mercedesae]